MAEAMDAGALDYVMKPINKIELLARIRSVLRLKYEKDLREELIGEFNMSWNWPSKCKEVCLSVHFRKEM